VTVALAYDALLQQMAHALSRAQGQIEAAMRLAAEHGFAHWLCSCGVLQGWALIVQGQGLAGISQIRRGLEHLSAIGVRLIRPCLLGLLAEAYGAVGQVDEGLQAVDDALRLIHLTDESVLTASTRGPEAGDVANL
jgi:predicted ATPase